MTSEHEPGQTEFVTAGRFRLQETRSGATVGERTEHALLDFARACSLSAAASRLTTVADRDVRLVRRFDRLQGRSASKTNLISGHGRFLLSLEDAERIFTPITGTVTTQWHATMRRAGVTEGNCARIAPRCPL